jgi:polysaccharide biosynthesis protein PslJ
MGSLRLRRPDPAVVLVAGIGTGAVMLAFAGVAWGVSPGIPLVLVTTALGLAAMGRWLTQWRTLLSLVVLVILFVPIRRYTVLSELPFNLEPYRLLVAAIALAWLGSLLIQRDTWIARTGLEGPVMALAAAVLLGIVVNAGRIQGGLSEFTIKKCTFFISFVLVMYLTASVLRRRAEIDRLVSVLVAGGAAVAACALLESRTGFNPFDHLQRVLPVLHFDETQTPMFTASRGGRPRAYASAQHSIALGAALVMLVPLAIYLARRTGKGRWWGALAILVLGALCTVSRTAMVMLVVELLVLIWLQPATMRRLWPFLLPFLLAAHVVAPGTLGALKEGFMPKGGLIAEQQSGAGTYGSGRLADLGPGLRDWSRTPVLGQGFGTRITDRNDPYYNAPILDDEWLGTLLETGAAGVLAILWLFVRAIRKLATAARVDSTERSWLLAGLAAAIYAYAIGMATYDAFSFIQVTFLLFIVLGVAAAELRMRPRPLAEPPSA